MKCEFTFEDMFSEFAPELLQCGAQGVVTIMCPGTHGDPPEAVHLCAFHAKTVEEELGSHT